MLRHSNHDGTVTSICFSPDGRFLASGATDGRVFLWEPASGEKPRELPLPWAAKGRPVTSLAFHPDSAFLCVGRSIPRIDSLRAEGVGHWELSEPSRFHAASAPVGLYPALAFADDKTLLVFSHSHPDGGYSYRGRINRWPFPQYDGKANFAAAPGSRNSFITTHQELVATVTSVPNWQFPILGWKSSLPVKRCSSFTSLPKGLLFHPMRPELIGATSESLYRWDLDREDTVVEASLLPIPERPPINAMAFSTDGTRLAVGRKQGQIDVMLTEDWSRVDSYPWRIGDVRCVAFVPDGLRCAAGTNRGVVVIWDLE